MAENPLARFNAPIAVRDLWNDDVQGADGQLLRELLEAVQEELDGIDRGDASVKNQIRASERLRGERHLDYMLEEDKFSHSMLDGSARKLEDSSAELTRTYRQSTLAEFEAADAAEAEASAMAAAEEEAARRGGGITAADVRGSSRTQEAFQPQLSREDSIAKQFESLSVHSSSFTVELLEVSRWLERRRVQDRDAIDTYREQVLLRADRLEPAAPAAAEPRGATKAREAAAAAAAAASERLLTPAELAAMGVGSEASLSDEVSARVDSARVLDALDEVEIRMASTLQRFQERLGTLRRGQSEEVRSELASMEAALASKGEATNDAEALDELRRTVARLRMQLERAAAEAAERATGEGDDAGLSPEAEVLALLQQSSENQARLTELQHTASQLEAKLRIARVTSAEVHSEARVQAQQARACENGTDGVRWPLMHL